jgi:hypothetical protein
MYSDRNKTTVDDIRNVQLKKPYECGGVKRSFSERINTFLFGVFTVSPGYSRSRASTHLLIASAALSKLLRIATNSTVLTSPTRLPSVGYSNNGKWLI